MTHPNIPKLAAAMDKSPAFKSFVERSATPYGLDLLAKYRMEKQVNKRNFTIVAVTLVIAFIIIGIWVLPVFTGGYLP